MISNEKLILDLTILGFFLFICLVMCVLRYENRTQFIKDFLLGFAIGCSCYLLLNNWFTDIKTKVGITGVIILCSRPLYEWINVFIKEWLTKFIMKRKRKSIKENEEHQIDDNNE